MAAIRCQKAQQCVVLCLPWDIVDVRRVAIKFRVLNRYLKYILSLFYFGYFYYSYLRWSYCGFSHMYSASYARLFKY